jgi:hypothetical protein
MAAVKPHDVTAAMLLTINEEFPEGGMKHRS